MSSKFFQHPQALVETSDVGNGTRIWAFAHILPGAHIGEDCNVCDHTFIENDVVVGDRVTIKCGVQLWDGIRIEDDVFIGPNVSFTNDPRPRSRRHLDSYPQTVVRRGASVGSNATILPGVSIGQYSMVGAGAVVTLDVPAFAVVVGNPARIVHYTDEAGARATKPSYLREADEKPKVQVEGVTLHRAPMIEDLRGNLCVREVGDGLSFTPQRFFVVCDVPSEQIRGEHAHRACHQLLVCLRSSVSCLVDDGTHRQSFLLDGPTSALYVPPMVWAVQHHYKRDTILLVLASDPYDPDDYIRNYDEFLTERAALDRRRKGG